MKRLLVILALLSATAFGQATPNVWTTLTTTGTTPGTNDWTRAPYDYTNKQLMISLADPARSDGIYANNMWGFKPVGAANSATWVGTQVIRSANDASACGSNSAPSNWEHRPTYNQFDFDTART